MTALIVIGCIFGYTQVGFLTGILIYKYFEQKQKKSGYQRRLTEDQYDAACYGGVFWPIGAPIGLGCLLFRWEYRVITRQRKKHSRRAKRQPLHLRHRKMPDHEAIARMESELKIGKVDQ